MTPDASPLTPKAAARRLGLSPSYLSQARTRGAGPAYFKIGRKVLYQAADLDAWLAAHRRQPEAGDSADV